MPNTAAAPRETRAQGLTREQNRLARRDPSHGGIHVDTHSAARTGVFTWIHAPRRAQPGQRTHGGIHVDTRSAGVHSAGSIGKSVSEVDTADRSRSLQLDWLATAYALAGHVGSRRRSSCGRGGGRVDVVVGDGVGNAVGGAAGGMAIAVASAWAHRWR